MEGVIIILSVVLVIAFIKRDWIKELRLKNRRNKIYESATSEQRVKRTKIVEEAKNYHNFSSWNEENELLKFECLSIEEMEAKLEVWKAKEEKQQAEEEKQQAEEDNEKMEIEKKLGANLENLYLTDFVLTSKQVRDIKDYTKEYDGDIRAEAIANICHWLKENMSVADYDEFDSLWDSYFNEPIPPDSDIDPFKWREAIVNNYFGACNDKKKEILLKIKKEQANTKSNGGNG
ncbi:MAG: hypothetical protein LBO69_04195 [Ignavibacteria bacterium]|jgi:hypothetical protein|nr:hypothetical protein [Ignavibacteria bacterium]